MPIDALSVLYAQLTRDLLAIAKFLLTMSAASANIMSSVKEEAMLAYHTLLRLFLAVSLQL